MSKEEFSTIVADKQSLMSESLAALCQGFSGCRVLGHCANGDELLRMVELLKPDVALVDLWLPGVATMELLRRCRGGAYATKFFVLAEQADRKTVFELLRSGAKGFLLKSGNGRQLEEALRQVVAGAIYVTPSISLQNLKDPKQEEREDPLRTLSSREYQVFTMLVAGIRAKDIASKLELSPKTVDTYRANLMRKLDLHDVPSLVKFAIQRKLTQ